MKKFNFLVLFICLASSMLSCSVSAHTFGTNYFYDNEYHWQSCIDVNCNASTNKNHHQIEAIDSKEATCTEDGYIVKGCKTCGFTLPKEIISHSGHATSEYKSNEVNHWYECSKCHEIFSLSPHSFGEWIIDKKPTTETDGLKHKECSICHKVINEIIPADAHHVSENWSTDENYHWHSCSHCSQKFNLGEHVPSDWIIDRNATSTVKGLKHKECLICHKTLETKDIPFTDKETIDFYAINDFHGETTRLAKTMGFLAEKSKQTNSVLINSGDTYQGSMLSNSNYGQLLTKCMNRAGFDALTIGNHDFDWGIEKLDDIINASNMPVLGANVYNYNFDTKRYTTFASEHFEKYAIKTLENGIKIGIIGVIGSSQITSISTNLVKDFTFLNPLTSIKNLASELRNSKKCDIVVASCHGDGEDLLGSTYRTDTKDLEDYVDAVFLAHTHQKESYSVNGLQFIQGGGNGQYVSNIKLSFDRNAQDKVTVSSCQNIPYSDSWPNDSIVDTYIEEERDKIKDEGNEILATNVPYLSKYSAGNLAAHSMAYAAAKQGYKIDLALTNARSSIDSGDLTYEKLYKSFPFDNRVYIAEVYGMDLLSEATYDSNKIYRVNNKAFSSMETYTVAIIDYLLLHTDYYRYYDYFPNQFKIVGELTKSGYDVYNYRFVLRDFLRENKSIYFKNYISDNNRNNSNLLYTNVTF